MNGFSKSIPPIALALASALLLGACAAGSPQAAHAAAGGVLSEFLLGFWHGLIAPVTLIIEVINQLVPHAIPFSARMFETSATHAAYDVGFYIGLVGGPSLAWSRRPRRTVA